MRILTSPLFSVPAPNHANSHVLLLIKVVKLFVLELSLILKCMSGLLKLERLVLFLGFFKKCRS